MGLRRFGYLTYLAGLMTQPLNGIALPAHVLFLQTKQILLYEKQQGI